MPIDVVLQQVFGKAEMKLGIVFLLACVVLFFDTPIGEVQAGAQSPSPREKPKISNEQLNAVENEISTLTQQVAEIKAAVQSLSPTPKPPDPKQPLQAVRDTAELAINASKEAIASMESFYRAAGTHMNLLMAGMAAVLTTLVGLGAWEIRQFKQAAYGVLDKKLKNVNNAIETLSSGHNKATLSSAIKTTEVVLDKYDRAT